ncbi:MAG: ribonuclease J, partial [Thermomicrobiales bacterium]
PMAALSRIANGDQRDVEIGEGDTVIVSSTPIPGNETAVYRVIDKLFRAGAEVVYGQRARVHVSGHASRDELLKMVQLTGPRDIVPTHGEPRHMAQYADLLMESGIPRDRIHFAENGEILLVTPDRVIRDGRVEAGVVYVDGLTVGEVGDVVVRDRRSLARDGFVVVALTVDRESGELAAGPELETRGFVHVAESEELLEATRQKVREVVDASVDGRNDEWATLKRQIRDATAQYLFRETGRRPTVLPVVMEV